MMNSIQNAGESLWRHTAEQLPLTRLEQDLETDVCIVGAGIAGLSAAYLLQREGRSVVVIDDGPIGGGQTVMTTAHLSNEVDDLYSRLEGLHGTEGARLAAESHTAAIDCIEQIIRTERFDCDFVRLDGYLFAPPGQAGDILDREFETVLRTGSVKVERVSRAPLEGFETGPALRFRDQAQFHPLQYLNGLARVILQRKGRIYTGAHATSIEGGEPARIETKQGAVITAKAVIVATNTPVNDSFAIHTKQAPYLTYVVGARIPKGAVPPALFWDTEDPYHYVRVQSQPRHDVLIIGGEDHKTGQADDGALRLQRLADWGRARFPMMQEIEFTWAGQVMEPVDGVAFIGRNPLDQDNVYIITGDSGMGMTHGTLGGLLLTDLILGRPNPWTNLYDPARKSLRSLPTFGRENLNVAVQYADWITPGDVASAEQIPPGGGAVIRRGLHKVACSRDAAGKLTECSATCPHLGCIVHWNSTERTWDCPCHGSRFLSTGEVINGPANSGLAPPAETSADQTSATQETAHHMF